MPTTRDTTTAPSERLLNIVWNDDSDPEPPTPPAIAMTRSTPATVRAAKNPAAAVTAAAAPRTRCVRIRIDEVFHAIGAYQALIENGIAEDSILGRTLLSQANSTFNVAFANLRARFGIFQVYCDVPGGDCDPSMDDATETAVAEVRRLQGIAANRAA